MPEAAENKERVVLSGNLEDVAGGPLASEEMLRLCEDYEGHVIRANVSRTTDGTDRKVVRPTITEVNGASAIEICDVLHKVAWAHCNKTGERSRYCCNLYVEEDGKVRSSPVRAYFWLSPEDENTETRRPAQETGKAVGPSLEYVHGLEEMNLRSLDRLSRAAARTLARDEQTQRLAFNAIELINNTKLAEGANAVALEDARARHARNDKILGGIVSIFPQIAEKYLKLGAANTGAPAQDGDGPLGAAKPGDRVRAFLTGEELERFKEAITEEKWEEFEACADIAEARKLLATLPSECAKKIVDAIGEEKIYEMSSWR